MKRLLVLPVLLALASSAAAAGWSTQTWTVSEFALDTGGGIALTCRGEGLQFVLKLPLAIVGKAESQRSSVDLAIDVLGRSDTWTRYTARAAAHVDGDLMHYRLEGEAAGQFASGVSYSKEVIIGVLGEGVALDQSSTMVARIDTLNGETENATIAVFKACPRQ